MKYLTIDKKYSPFGIGNNLLNVYNAVGSREFATTVEYHSSFDELVKFVYSNYSQTAPTNSNPTQLLETKVELPDTKRAIVGFSGGVDSTYQALLLRDLGYEVTLLHLARLNKSYPDEAKKAKGFSEDCGFSYIEIPLTHSDAEARKDNPIKNQMILGYALDFGIERGISNYALGAYQGHFAKDLPKESWGSDNEEQFNLFVSGIESHVSGFKYHNIKTSKFGVVKFMAEKYPEILDKHVTSCLSPYRFKRMLHDKNSKKFSISLFKDRCGSCDKCALEYINLRHLNLYPDNPQYLHHCCNIIRKNLDVYSLAKVTAEDTDQVVVNKILSNF